MENQLLKKIEANTKKTANIMTYFAVLSTIAVCGSLLAVSYALQH